MAVSDDQQFCLRWNNFQAYITSQFETLRDDDDFVDVTLACEGQRLGAHKVVLSACSPFFKELFKTNPCPHPIIFMRDVELRHVIALLEFMYAGEVNVAQAHLSGFLKTAESLQIRGLTDASKEHKENDNYPTEIPTPIQTNQCSTTSNQSLISKSKQHLSESKNSPSRIVTSTQDKLKESHLSPSSPVAKKRTKTESDENERLADLPEMEAVSHNMDDVQTLNSSMNPFTMTPNNHVDINSEFIEPKLELPDYSEEDTSHDESQNFMDLNDGPNTFSAIPGGMDIIPGTSGMGGDASQDSQACDNQKLHSLDPRPCSMCGRVYSNLSNLRQHIRLIHNPTQVRCPVCNKSFKSTLYLKRHLVTCRYHHGQSKYTVNQLLNKMKDSDGSQNNAHNYYRDQSIGGPGSCIKSNDVTNCFDQDMSVHYNEDFSNYELNAHVSENLSVNH